MSEVEKLPFALQWYIGEQKRRIEEGNSVDYRATPRAELDECQTNCIKWFRAGERLIASTTTEDIDRCMRLFMLEHRREPTARELWRTRINNQEMLVPPHVTLLPKMQLLRAAIA